MAHFLEVLSEQRGGDIINDLDVALTAVLAAVRQTGKEGKLMLTLSISDPAGKTVFLKDEVKTKIPEPSKGGSVFFTTEDNELHSQNPAQFTMDLHEVNTERPPLKDVK